MVGALVARHVTCGARRFCVFGLRIIVTMGMPGQIYRLYFGAHSLKSLERNILKFAGVSPVHETLIGMVEALGDRKRAQLLERMRRLGAQAA